jgi:ubiquilin
MFDALFEFSFIDLQQMQPPAAAGGAQPQAAQQQNPFAAMMMNPLAFGGGMGGGFGAAGAPVQPPEVRYASQLRQLQDMGFYDQAANIRALTASGGMS